MFKTRLDIFKKYHLEICENLFNITVRCTLVYSLIFFL